MKILFFVFIILLSNNWIWAQQNAPISSVSTEFRKLNDLPALSKKETATLDLLKTKPIDRVSEKSRTEFEFDKKIPDVISEKRFAQNGTGGSFRWKPALIQSGIFLGIQHGFRLLQKKTRDEFGGKFFNDWGKSIRNIHGWNDGDNAFTNYIAHPLQGGVTGRIFINNSPRASKQEFGALKTYWESRLKAFVWSMVWSVQFELGPISEANLGNVGLRRKNGFSTAAWVDLVITPTVGTGVVILEDIFDKYVLERWFERKIRNKTVIKILRILFSPTTGAANVLRGKYPWWRENRPI